MSNKKNIFIIISLMLIITLSAFLNFYKIGNDNLWMDEILTINRSEMPVLSIPINSPNKFYYISSMVQVERIVTFLKQCPNGTLARMPFAIISIIGVIFIFLLGKRIGGWYLGVLCSILLATNLQNIYFSQEARYYSIVITNTIFFLWAEYKLVNNVCWKNAFFFILAAIFLPYAHPSILPLIAAQPVVFVSSIIHTFLNNRFSKRKINSKNILIFTTCSIVSCIATLPIVISAISLANKPIGHKVTRTPISLHEFSDFIIKVFREQLTSMTYHPEIFYPLFYVFVTLALIGIIFTFKKSWILTIHFLGTLILITFITTHFAPPQTPKARYYIFLLPFCIMFISLGVTFIIASLARLLEFYYRIITRNSNNTNQIIVNLITVILFLSTLAAYSFTAVPVLKKYYKTRPHVHAPVRQAVSYMIKYADTNSLFIGPVITYDEYHTFPYYIQSLTSKNIDWVYRPWDVDSNYMTDNQKKYVSWFISVGFSKNNLLSIGKYCEIRNFGKITIIKSINMLSYDECLSYSKIIYSAAISNVENSWHKKALKKALEITNKQLELIRLSKYDDGNIGKEIFNSNNANSLYKSKVKSGKGTINIINSNNESFVNLKANGANDVYVLTKTLKLKPGLYKISADVKMDEMHDYGVHGKLGLIIEMNNLKILPLRWYNKNKNWITKERWFVINKTTHTSIFIGYKILHAFADSTIKNVVLMQYALTNKSIMPKYIINDLPQNDIIFNQNCQSNILIKNGSFNKKLKNWQLWHSAKALSNTVKIINVPGNKFKNTVRIENPMKKLVGIQQRVHVVSNAVYKLSGIARSLGNDKSKIFGGRIGFYLPPQKEKQIVWMSEHDKWWKKELVFTNNITGTAIVYVHMGYGNVASTGEFTNIRLEKLSE